MKLIYSILLLTSFLSLSVSVNAQTEGEDTTTGVVIHADPRLSLLLASMKPKSSNSGISVGGSKSGMIRSGRGYRVQIYNGNDRNKATAVKVDFIRRFPKMGTYMSYIQPQFRIKVGDFRSRGEAQKFVEQVSSIYSPVMVVPDIIVINTFKNDQ